MASALRWMRALALASCWRPTRRRRPRSAGSRRPAHPAGCREPSTGRLTRHQLRLGRLPSMPLFHAASPQADSGTRPPLPPSNGGAPVWAASPAKFGVSADVPGV